MKTEVPQELIEKSVRRYQLQIASNKKPLNRPPRVITISRMFGAGGISVSRLLGKRLECPVWDRQILDILADQSHGKYQASMFESLDEKTQGLIESFLSSLGGQLDRQTYFYLLPRAISIIAQQDAIILGRGANLFVPNARKVLLKASLSTRKSNVMQLLKTTEEQALAEIERRENDQNAFLRELADKFHKPKTEQLEYDLELNMDRFRFERAADVIMAAI